MALSDRDAVKLEGHPSWFTICKTDPNLPPPPSAVLVKKARKEDIFHRVRRGTGYALQSLRRPMSAGIDALAAENGGRLSPSSSIDSLEASFKKLQAANLTMPRRTRKERKPLSALFTSPPHVSGQPVSAASDRNGWPGAGISNSSSSGHDVVSRVGAADESASLSVPTSPLMTRKTARESSTLRRKKLGGILSVLRGSLLPTMHSIDLTTLQRKRAATEAGEDFTDGDMLDEGGEGTKRRWSLSGDVKHRIVPPLSPPFSASSSPFSSPQHTTRQPLTSTTSSSSLDPFPGVAHRRAHSEITPTTTDYQESDDVATEDGKKSESAGLLALDVTSSAVLSDSSWYSAEEELKDEETPKKQSPTRVLKTGSYSASKLLYSRSHTVDEGSEGLSSVTKMKSRSAENLLLSGGEEEEEGEGGEGLSFREHLPLTRTRCHALSHGSSCGSSVEDDYSKPNSRPHSRNSGGPDEMGGITGSEESSLDSSTRLKAIGRVNAISLNPRFPDVFPVDDGEKESPSAADNAAASSSSLSSLSGERISRWRSFEDLLGALPLQKRRQAIIFHVFPTFPSIPEQQCMYFLKRFSLSIFR